MLSKNIPAQRRKTLFSKSLLIVAHKTHIMCQIISILFVVLGIYNFGWVICVDKNGVNLFIA